MSLMSSCHCGKIRIEVPATPSNATECNCSFCSRVGAIWAYFPLGQLRFLSTEGQSMYSSKGINRHYFCSCCGIHVWSDVPDWTAMQGEGSALSSLPRRHSLNLRTVDNLDWAAVNVEKVDGRSGW